MSFLHASEPDENLLCCVFTDDARVYNGMFPSPS